MASSPNSTSPFLSNSTLPPFTDESLMPGASRGRLLRIFCQLLILPLLLGTCTADGIAVDWHYYPSASQPCLESAVQVANCDESVVQSLNACICANGGNFLANAYKCIYSNDPGDIQTVYNTMILALAGSNLVTTSALTLTIQAVTTIMLSGSAQTTILASSALPPEVTTLTLHLVNSAGTSLSTATFTLASLVNTASASNPTTSSSATSASKRQIRVLQLLPLPAAVTEITVSQLELSSELV
ncbi:hypothetical protein BT63DRAFT_411689 [Microthyrium microscopicum]|uniref:Uncharacterized protein n=1 Tax=Microthyrium microscopicum TaxID=703497 RepID=A0A6A6UMW8_9PEZI|nr:hypothetical protein BT63DRAFT_411689 [Microthyrium microscopicum]